MRVLRSQTRRAAAAAEPVVTPQKKVSRKPTNKTASKDAVEIPTPPPSTRKGKVTKAKKNATSKKQKNEAGEASQDAVGLTDDTLPTPSPSTRKGKGKVTKPATEDEPSQAEKETEPEEQKEETDQPFQAPVDLTDATLSPLPSNRKRKLPAEVASSKAKKETTPKKQKKEAGQASEDPVALNPSPSTSKRKLPTEDESPKETPSKKQKKEKAEKRLCKFRTEPPKFFDRVLSRSLGQTFYILNRTSHGTEACPEEDFELVGATGNTYTVSIGNRLSCNCPHHSLGFQQCKHIIFIMKKVLNAPDELVYQQALISTELKSIFDSAPSFSVEPQEEPVKRRPIEGDCPICYCKLEEMKKASIVWCAAACGHNFHMQCLKICARPGKVTCPVCRSDWKGNKKLVTDIQKDDEQMIDRFVDAGHGVNAK